MTLSELIQLIKLLLKFSVVVAKNTHTEVTAIDVARVVADTLSASWGDEHKSRTDANDLPF